MVDQFVLWSTDGPVEHVKTCCVNRHIFLLPTERLPHGGLTAERGEPIRTDRGVTG
jgi:hypothetical protein